MTRVTGINCFQSWFDFMARAICHLEIIAITGFTATGIFSSFESVLEKYEIPMANLLSFTSDNCNVMKVEQGAVIAKLRTIQPRIIHVHCICHLVSLCTKSAADVEKRGKVNTIFTLMSKSFT